MKFILSLAVVASLLTISLTLLSQTNQAQVKPGFFVLHLNKVANENVDKIDALLDSISTPVLNDLIREKKLVSWGQLTHGWGDEWNYNFFFITESHRSFLDFWEEYIARCNRKSPGWWSKAGPLITAHKDNMYAIRQMK